MSNHFEPILDGKVLVTRDWNGHERRMGSLPDRDVPLVTMHFEDLCAANAVALPTPAEIEAIARSGILDGQRLFGDFFNDDQHSHGSCNGFAEAGGVGTARARRGEPAVRLSGAYAYSLMNGGVDQGSQLASALANSGTRGICRAELCGWDAIYPNRYNKAQCDEDAQRFKGFLAYPIKELASVWAAGAMGFDVMVAVHVSRAFYNVNASGVAGVDAGSGNHAVRFDGIVWENGEVVGTGMNSWGKGYGYGGGRMKLRQAHFAQPFRYHQFWALPSTTDDGRDASKPPRLVIPAQAQEAIRFATGPRLIPAAG